MRSMRRYAFVAIFLLLSSCNLEPRYVRPCMEIPCTWRLETSQVSTIANVRWWEALEDPVLNELILLALNNNKDLMVAVSRVCEFMGRYQVARSPLFPQINFNAEAIKERIPPAQ